MIGTRRIVLQIAVLAEHDPERLRLAQQAQLGPLARDPVAPQREEPLDAAEVRRRQHGQVGPPIAVEEIEDVVPARLRAGAERRPRHRRHRRKRGLQAPIAARLRELLEVRQQPLLHEPIGEHRVLAVQADDDESPDAGARRLASAQPPPEHAERPEQQGHHGRERRREEHEKRREQREARAGPDVGVGRLRRREEQHAGDCEATTWPAASCRICPAGCECSSARQCPQAVACRLAASHRVRVTSEFSSSRSLQHRTIRSTHSSTVRTAVSRDRSGATGTSYGALTPGKSSSSPASALA